MVASSGGERFCDGNSMLKKCVAATIQSLAAQLGPRHEALR